MKSDEEWQKERKEMLAFAKTRVPMFVGSAKYGHYLAVRSVLRLVWQAKVFQKQQSAVIDLSPHQCVVRCYAGPLRPEIRQLISWGGKREMTEDWRAEFSAYLQSITITMNRGWKYCFSGPTGPRLAEPTYSAVLAKKLIWGLRTEAGIWCQGYAEGWPVSAPFLRAGRSPIGIFAAADLDPTYFTGLPFTEEDVTHFSAMRGKQMDKAEPKWKYPENLTVRWHSDDVLLRDEMLTAKGIDALLSENNNAAS